MPVAVEGLRGPRLVVASDLPLLGRAVAEVAAGLSPGGAAPAVARDGLVGHWGLDDIAVNQEVARSLGIAVKPAEALRALMETQQSAEQPR